MTRDLEEQMILEKERDILVARLSEVENELIFLDKKRDDLNNNLSSLEEKKHLLKKKMNAAGKVGKYKKMKKP
jgi:hypothetical protein